MELLFEQINSTVDPKLPLVSNLANVSALLYKIGDVNWSGIYMVLEDGLYLGPFQGDVACTYIPFSKGVCGKAYRDKEIILVDDVNKFPGHIACSSLSKSEIVAPIIVENEVVAVIDIDAPIYSRFKEEEKELLRKVAELLAPLFEKSN